MIESFFNVEVMRRFLPAILSGMRITLELTALIIVTGVALGLVLAVIRTRQIRALSALIVLFVDAFRALPPLVVLIVAYFGLPYLELSPSGFVAAWLSLTLVLAAFSEEIFWASILSIDRGQWEAARSTGLTAVGTLRWVVLPQAVRTAIAPLTNRAIAIGKNTALASVVAVPEILNQASNAQAQAANPTPLTMAAIAYLVIFLPLVVVSRWVETRFAWKR